MNVYGIKGLFFILLTFVVGEICPLTLASDQPLHEATYEATHEEAKEAIDYYQALESLVNKYTRPLTILEILGDDVDTYCTLLAPKKTKDVCYVTLFKKHDTKEQERIVRHAFSNVIVLSPHEFYYDTIETLGRCEHLDIVLVRNLEHFFERRSRAETFNVFLTLGDFVFMEMRHTTAQALEDCIAQHVVKLKLERPETVLYLFETNKKGLDIARWNLWRKARAAEPRYPVTSTFSEKKLHKSIHKSDVQPTDYCRGINLQTAFMLRFVHPSDSVIRHNLQLLQERNPDHNDAIIGNMVLQGTKLVLIDFNDKRRNIKITRCMKAALKLFQGDRLRYSDPRDCMEKYRRLLR